MMKAESFNWQRTGKICSGIKDFGLLREKCTDDENKPNFSSIYFSRAVFTIGVIAGITFIMCLVLADKYQKSVNLSHHYASYVYERGREKLAALNATSETERHERLATIEIQQSILTDVDSGFGKIQNISNKLPIEEINHLVPMTTVLRAVNSSSRNAKQLPPFINFEASKISTNYSHSQYEYAEANATVKPAKKAVQSLADLLRRTELKPISVQKYITNASPSSSSSDAISSQATESSLRFAQLESYRHHKDRTMKNLQDLLKYINCNSATNCGLRYQPQVTTEATFVQETSPLSLHHESVFYRVSNHQQPTTTPSYRHDKERIQISLEHESNADFNITTSDPSETYSYGGSSSSSSSSVGVGVGFNADDSGSGNDMMYADTNAAPFYYTPYATEHQDRTIALDRLHNFRAASPLEINQLQLEQTENAAATATAEQIFHRFSNRMYHSRGMANMGATDNDNVDIRTQVLEPYLKPPTPPPTTLSFTPSYTTALFHGFNEFTSNENDLKPEATAIESSMTHIKPISLMVEIFPANDYELPGSLFGDNRYSRQQEPSYGELNPMNNPSSPLSWKLTTAASQNKMRLFVNLFPQQNGKQFN